MAFFFSRCLSYTCQKMHRKLPDFFLLGSNVCCLGAGSHWLWGGHSHLGRISWHRLLYTTRIAIACSCSFTCVRITLSLTEKSFTSNKTQHVKLSSSSSIDHFYFSSSKQKACSSQVFLHEKNARVLIWHFVSALHRWKISLVWSDIFVTVKLYKQKRLVFFFWPQCLL